MTDHINMNEEISPQKYESYSSNKTGELNTLEEPVLETIVIDVLLRKETSIWWARKLRLQSQVKAIIKNFKNSGISGDH